MMKTLTDEQRKFAEQNHDLVYKFLNENGLSESMYYVKRIYAVEQLFL